MYSTKNQAAKQVLVYHTVLYHPTSSPDPEAEDDTKNAQKTWVLWNVAESEFWQHSLQKNEWLTRLEVKPPKVYNCRNRLQKMRNKKRTTKVCKKLNASFIFIAFSSAEQRLLQKLTTRDIYDQLTSISWLYRDVGGLHSAVGLSLLPARRSGTHCRPNFVVCLTAPLYLRTPWRYVNLVLLLLLLLLLFDNSRHTLKTVLFARY